MEDTQQQDTCEIVRGVVVDTRVVIEPSSWAYPWDWHKKTDQQRHDWLVNWASEIMEFFRDHRHQDVNHVSAEPVVVDQCSRCHAEWEQAVCSDTGEKFCATCGTTLAEAKKEDVA